MNRKKWTALLSAFALVFSLCLPFSAEQSGRIAWGRIPAESFLSKADVPYALSAEDGVYNRLYNAFLSCAEEIDLSDLNVSVSGLLETLRAVAGDHPELFYLKEYSYTYNPADNIVFSLYPVYQTFDVPLSDAKLTFSRESEKILSLVGSSWSDLEKIVFLHDYLAAHFSYDTTYSVSDVYGFLTKKTGVCSAYASCYAYLLKKVGIESGIVTSTEMNHAWNVVNLDGNWYHVDVTWDDPLLSGGDQYGAAWHKNLLLSDSGIAATGHYQWSFASGAVSCTDTRYENADWKSSITPIAECGGHWYRIDSGRLYSDEDPSTPLFTFENWQASGGGYYIDSYSGLASFRGKLYFNTPSSLVAFDPASGTSEVLLSIQESGKQIYGMTLDGSHITYIVEAALGQSTDQRTFTIPFGFVLGDIDRNGKVNAADASILARFLAKWNITLPDPQAADINGDGRVNSQDSVLLARHLAKWDISYFR